MPGAPWSDGERKHSEETAREIDMEVRKIIADATDEVRGILHRWHPFGEPSVCRESGYHYRCRKKRGQRRASPPSVFLSFSGGEMSLIQE